jgi:hypothetical protein
MVESIPPQSHYLNQHHGWLSNFQADTNNPTDNNKSQYDLRTGQSLQSRCIMVEHLRMLDRCGIFLHIRCDQDVYVMGKGE